MICHGLDVRTGKPVAVHFDRLIERVEPSTEPVHQYLSPGWIDIQVNGFLGVDYNSPQVSRNDIARSIEFLFSTGVTRFYPTVITGSSEDMTGALANLAQARSDLPNGDAMDGFHVEGPYISGEEGPRGAHPKAWVRPPDWDEFRRMQEAAQGYIRLLTLSPEWPDAPRFIEKVVNEGVVISIGHTSANTQQIRDAVLAGATLSTHLGNGAHSVLPRHPNYIWDQLAEDGLTASFIVDGIHIPKSFLITALRTKGISRSVLVTDASAPAGCKPGRYQLGEQAVDLTDDGRVVLAGQSRLAGSALRMDAGVTNLIRLAGLNLADAVQMATVNAARAGRVPQRTKGLEAGERADLILFRVENGAVQVDTTWVGGRRVYG
jgi:N-acetylglucosamine-6-phosphate deacetylase